MTLLISNIRLAHFCWKIVKLHDKGCDQKYVLIYLSMKTISVWINRSFDCRLHVTSPAGESLVSALACAAGCRLVSESPAPSPASHPLPTPTYKDRSVIVVLGNKKFNVVFCPHFSATNCWRFCFLMFILSSPSAIVVCMYDLGFNSVADLRNWKHVQSEQKPFSSLQRVIERKLLYVK